MVQGSAPREADRGEATPARVERERAQRTYAARHIGEVLAGLDIRLEEFVGQPHSPFLPIEPANPEDFDTEKGLVARETIDPTILHDGRVLMRSKVALAKRQ